MPSDPGSNDEADVALIDDSIRLHSETNAPIAADQSGRWIRISSADRVVAPWWTASMLLPSGSSTNAA